MKKNKTSTNNIQTETTPNSKKKTTSIPKQPLINSEKKMNTPKTKSEDNGKTYTSPIKRKKSQVNIQTKDIQSYFITLSKVK